MKWLSPLTMEEWRNLVGDNARNVLEVGCHDGSDTAMLLEAFPQATLHCWEPDPRPAARFRQRFAGNPRVRLQGEAVCDVDGEAPWYASRGSMAGDEHEEEFSGPMRADWDASGSIMVPTGHVGFPTWLWFQQQPPVRTIRLDTWLAAHPVPEVDLIWADIQGAELRMIRGALETLKRTRYLYLEVYDQEELTPGRDGVPKQLYREQPTLRELCAALPDWECRIAFHNDNVLWERKT